MAFGARHSGRFAVLATDVDDDLDSSSLVDALEFDLTHTDHEEVLVQSTADSRPQRRLVLVNSAPVLDASVEARVVPTHIDSGSGEEMVNTSQFDMTAGDTDQEDVRSEGGIPRMCPWRL